MKKKLLWGIIVISAVAIIYGFLSSSEKSELLTTNIDVVNKTIKEEDSFDDRRDGTFLSLVESIFQNLSQVLRDDMTMLAAAASPSVKFVKVYPGMRKEELVSFLSQKLAWNDFEEKQFLNIAKPMDMDDVEGYYYPDAYLLPPGIGGYETGKMMINRFNDKVMTRYASSTKKIISVDVALKIASIIEREAGGKNDMRLISGIIWNRIFKDMSLDMDATLQYVKGNEGNGWWPKINSEDKFIESPYNTYRNKGLTPTPISNPQLASIEAALNPKKTNCLFYLHDKYRRIHCSATYKEHVKNITRYYGK